MDEGLTYVEQFDKFKNIGGYRSLNMGVHEMQNNYFRLFSLRWIRNFLEEQLTNNKTVGMMFFIHRRCQGIELPGNRGSMKPHFLVPEPEYVGIMQNKNLYMF